METPNTVLTNLRQVERWACRTTALNVLSEKWINHFRRCDHLIELFCENSGELIVCGYFVVGGDLIARNSLFVVGKAPSSIDLVRFFKENKSACFKVLFGCQYNSSTPHDVKGAE